VRTTNLTKLIKQSYFLALGKCMIIFLLRFILFILIENCEITDIYCVFLSNALSLLGYPSKIPGKQNCNISKFIESNGISVHTTIYPGGGFEYGCMNQVVDG
jgi:hypothetical protein